MPSRLMSRSEKINFLDRRMAAKENNGLELGPNIRPMFRKSKNYNIKCLESVSTDELRARARANGMNPDIVEPIDYILDRDVALPELVADAAPFHHVTSSHVIEHIPDPVRHLQEVASVLKEGGHYGLLIPDCNLCFDCMRPVTTLGQIVEAYVEQRTAATLAMRIDEIRYSAKLKQTDLGGWTELDARVVAPKYQGRLDRIRTLTASRKSRGTLWFGHQWGFSPRSFLSIFYDLRELRPDATEPDGNPPDGTHGLHRGAYEVHVRYFTRRSLCASRSVCTTALGM